MRETTISVIHREKPVLLDKVLQHIQMSLTDNLAWLDLAFGRAYKIISTDTDGNKVKYPAAYSKNGEYISLLPNDNIGNFSWFDIYDPQDIINDIPLRPAVIVNAALVFWLDVSSVYEDDSMLHTEEIKDEILKVLTQPGTAGSGSKLVVNRVYEDPDNIYRDYNSLDRQFFMHPYYSLRVEFTLKTRDLCQHYIK